METKQPTEKSLYESMSDIQCQLRTEALKLGLIETGLSTMQDPDSISVDDIIGAGYLIEDVIKRIGELADQLDGLRLIARREI